MIIDLYYLICAVIPHIFILTEELVMPTKTSINGVNKEIEIQPLTAEIKIRKCLK